MDKTEITNIILKKAYENFFSDKQSVNLVEMSKELEVEDVEFWNIVNRMHENSLISPYTMGGNFKITSEGVMEFENNHFGDNDLIEQNQKIRRDILVSLAEVYEGSGVHSSQSLWGFAGDHKIGQMSLINNLSVLNDLGHLEMTTLNSVKITHLGLKNVEDNRKKSELEDQFKKLQTMEPHRRGREFQKLLAKLLQANGWDQEEGVRTSNEEMDIIISKGREFFLIECKWENKPIEANVVRELLGKLENRVGINGLIVSYSGFTSGAIDQAKAYANKRIILLFSSDDVDNVMSFSLGFDDLLDHKYKMLITRKEIL